MDVELWCYIKGDTVCFRVSIPRTQSISRLKERIFEKGRNSFNGLDAKDLILTKIDVDPQDRETNNLIEAGQYQPPSDHPSRRLHPMNTLSDIWPDEPPRNCLHIFVEPPAGGGSPTLVQTAATVAPLDPRPQNIESARSLADFLRLVTLPSRATTATTSTQTHPYDTISVLISDKDFPFVAIKLQDMASSMVNDLFGRVLPGYPIVDEPYLDQAKVLASLYTVNIVPTPIGREPSVWRGTHRILDTCITCLGAVQRRFTLELEVWNSLVNVQMDSVIRSTREGEGIVLVVEDKSPKIFNKHCTEEKFDGLCGTGFLDMHSKESGLRSIFFKLTVYMVQEGLRWGILNCGTHMRIIRIEYKDERPYAIVSEQIEADDSVYSLVCYMLLTAKDDIPIFDGIGATVPVPPQVMGSRDVGAQTRNHKAPSQLIALVPPEDLTTMVLHTTAAAGRLPVDIPMTRVDKMQTPVTYVRSAEVYVKDFLGAGGFGRVFLADLFIHNLCYGQVVVKLANAGVEAYLDIEARAYAKLRSLHGVGIPRYYGHFAGECAGVQYRCILVDVCGDPVKTIPNLPLFPRLEIFRILLIIHRQGVMHNDFSPMNILWTNSRIRLIDFSAANIDHECSGMGSCEELSSAVTELRLTPLHTQFAILWALWSDTFHPSVSRQFTIAIALVLFVTGLWSTYSKGLLP